MMSIFRLFQSLNNRIMFTQFKANRRVDMDLLKEFKSELISFFIGAFFSTTLLVGRKIVAYIKHKRHISKLKQTGLVFDDDLNIYTIENAVPEYYDLQIIPSTKKLYVDVPDDLKGKMPKSQSFHAAVSFDGSSSYRDLSIQTGIYDLEKLINHHRRIVAQDFINKANGCKFNEKKYGVFDIEIGTRIGDDESPVATITAFETDFFTYRVFSAIYRELSVRNADISKVSSVDKLRKYNCFICSIGINAIVCIDSPKYNREEIILSKRSGNAINYQNLYHISANEGLCFMDYNPSNGRFSLEKCIFRGIEEELGIPESSHVKNKTEYSLWDLFVSKETFDFGITCQVRIRGKYFDDIKTLLAKDKQFEISHLDSIVVEKQAIEKYVAERNFVPQGLYTLNSFFIRRFGRAISIPKKKRE